MKRKLLTLLVLLMTAATGAVAQNYKVSVKDGTEDAAKWEITPVEATTTGVAQGTTVNATYSGDLKVKSVKAVKKAPAEPVGNIVGLSALTENYVAQTGDVLTGTLGESHQISIAAGATVTLDNVSINADGSWNWDDYAGISCLGNATIILKDGTANTVKGFWDDYPGIHVPSGYTLIIQSGTGGTGSLAPSRSIGGGSKVKRGTAGAGSLTASSNGLGAGIGGGNNIACGNIIIQGGTIVANGGNDAAGIGGGRNASCGDITITTGVTSVTANSTGYMKALSIGAGNDRHLRHGDHRRHAVLRRLELSKQRLQISQHTPARLQPE